jgi:outer membrane protein
MVHKTTLILLATILGLTATAQQKEVKIFTLKEAIEYAKKNNYALKNGQLDVTASEKKVKEILASGIPNVSASGSFLNNVQIPVQRLPNFINDALPAGSPRGPEFINAQFGLPFSATGSVTASQLLFDGGFLMGVRASREYVQLSKVNLQRTSIETEVNVSKAYYGALSLKTNLALIDKSLQTLKQSVDEAEAAYKAGLLDKVSFDRASIQYSNLNLQRLRIADTYTITLMLLKLQMGIIVTDSITLTDELEKMYDESKSTLIEDKIDYSKRPEYKLLNQSIALNNLDKKRYQYGYTPSLSAFVTHQQNSFGQKFNELGNEWFPGTFWGLNLSIPIFDGFKKSAQIQQSKIAIEKTENDKKNFANLIEQQVSEAKLKLLRSNQQLELQRKNLELAEEVYRQTQIKLKNGVGSSIELSASLSDLETARTNYLTTLNDYFVAQLDLRLALGEIK